MRSGIRTMISAMHFLSPCAILGMSHGGMPMTVVGATLAPTRGPLRTCSLPRQRTAHMKHVRTILQMTLECRTPPSLLALTIPRILPDPIPPQMIPMPPNIASQLKSYHLLHC